MYNIGTLIKNGFPFIEGIKEDKTEQMLKYAFYLKDIGDVNAEFVDYETACLIVEAVHNDLINNK